jgi:hypothetical protein
MSVGLDIKLEGKAGEYLAQLLARLGSAGRRTLEGAAARSVADSVRRYLFALGTSRHTTARRLGATPTNVIGRTAENVAVRQGGEGTEVVVPHPMFRRAYRDILIRPQRAKALAIPVSGEAYDKAPRSFADLFVWKSKKGNKFLARRNGKRLTLVYLLKEGVTQPKDPSLLPTTAELSAAAKRGLAAMIRRIATRQGGAA